MTYMKRMSITDEQIIEAYKANNGVLRRAAESLDMKRSAYVYRVNRLRKQGHRLERVAYVVPNDEQPR